MSKKINCPFTTEELYEMYVLKLFSTRDIVHQASEILGCDVSNPVAGSWLRSAGIEIRRKGEAFRVKYRTDETLHKTVNDKLKNMRDKARQSPFCVNALHQNGSRLAHFGNKAYVRSMLLKQVTRKCSLPDCDNNITRALKEFRGKYELNFCCKACKMKFQNWYRLNPDEPYPAEGYQHVFAEMRLCALPGCNAEIVRTPSGFQKGALHFCGNGHRTIYYNWQRWHPNEPYPQPLTLDDNAENTESVEK